MKRGLMLSLVALLLPTLIVEAHAELVRAIPKPGAVVEPEVREIRLTFNEPISQGSSITLFAEGFRVVPGIRTQIEDADVSATIPTVLDPGLFTVQWTVIGDDGDASEGSYQFSVATGPSRAYWPGWLVIGLLAVGAYALWRRLRRLGGT